MITFSPLSPQVDPDSSGATKRLDNLLTRVHRVGARAITSHNINLIAVLQPGHDLERDLPMSEYALVSRGLLRRRFGFDVVVAEESNSLYRTYVEFFSRLREAPEARKGVLRLRV